MTATVHLMPTPSPATADLTAEWGQRLRAAIDGRCRMERAVRAIGAAVGYHIGGRHTFANLLTVDSLTALDQKNRFRAWLLLTTIAVDPAEFGLSDLDVPSGYDLARLTSELRRLRDARPNARQTRNRTHLHQQVPNSYREPAATGFPDRGRIASGATALRVNGG